MIITVLSDTHGNKKAISKMLDIMQESDLVVHLGDHAYDIDEYKLNLQNKLITVYGNCDGGGEDKIIEAENIKILITHGYKHGVKMGLTRLYLRAKEVGARLVLYGHTHIARVDQTDGITFVNPGCMTVFCSQPTYATVNINDGIVDAKIINLE